MANISSSSVFASGLIARVALTRNISGMRIEQIRATNLKSVAERFTDGNLARLAREVDTDSAYLYQILSEKTRKRMGDDLAQRIEARFGLPTGWMDQLHGDESPPVPSPRTIPIISAVQAGAWGPADDPYPVGFGDGEIPVEFLPMPVGPAAFGLRVKGDSMREEFRAGDIVIIDPHAPPRSREPVVAKRDEDDEATFKIYYPRGVDDAGHPIIELVPLNNHFQTLVISSKHPGRIIGPMVARIQGRREF